MAALSNITRFFSTTVGTSNIAIGSAVPSFLTPALASLSSGTVAYAVYDRATNAREIGTITYHSTGTALTGRTPTNSTNGGSAISLSGNSEVMITPRKEDIANLGEANTFTAVNTFDNQLRYTGDITPSTITADQNNYNPSGLSSAAVLRLASDAFRYITGVEGGADGRVLWLYNTGTNPISFQAESTGSSAANRITTNNLSWPILYQGGTAKMIYDGTASRWRLITGPLGIASQSEQETGTTDTSLVSPANQHFHNSAAKAWVMFISTAGTIQASYNVSGVDRNATGDYDVNYTDAFISANHVTIASVSQSASPRLMIGVTRNTTADNFNCWSISSAPALTDATRGFVVCYGTLA